MFRISPLPILAAALVLATSACSKEKPAKDYPVRGVVLKIDPAGKSASIDAEKIADWMEAMTMDYPVHDPKVLDGIKAGDHITATVHVPEDLNYWIDNVHKQ